MKKIKLILLSICLAFINIYIVSTSFADKAYSVGLESFNLPHESNGLAKKIQIEDTGAISVYFPVVLTPPNCFTQLQRTGTVYASGDASALWEAVADAVSGDTIKAAGRCVGTQLVNGDLQVLYLDKDLILSGGFTPGDWSVSDPIANPTILEAEGNGRVIFVTEHVHIALEGFALEQGIEEIGGGIYNRGVLTVSRSIIQENQARTAGGGIYNAQGEITLFESVVANNTIESGVGGGITNDAGTLRIINSQLVNNTTLEMGVWRDRGSGLYNFSGTLNLTNTMISHNGFSSHADVLHNHGGWVTINDSTIQDNHTTAIYNQEGIITISNNVIYGNVGENIGGIDNSGIMTVTNTLIEANIGSGIYNDGTMFITGSGINGNRTESSGGGINNEYGVITITYSMISNNVSNAPEFSGGGIYNQFGTLLLSHSTVSSNSALNGEGGGIYNHNASSFTMTHSTLSGNTAVRGAGIYNISTFALSNSTISGNMATGNGGGVYNRGSLTITNSTISNNIATNGHGLFNKTANFVDTSQIFVTNTILANSGNCYSDGVDLDIFSVGFNLINDNSCQFTGPGDQNNTDPQIGPLVDNGGVTWTHALLPGSVAIDTGNCSGGIITTDQRDVIRPQGNACDIGAFERE